MVFPVTPVSFPRMRRRLTFVRPQQRTRAVCDLTGLGPSAIGRVCCVIIVAAVLFGGTLVFCFGLNVAASSAVSSACAMFLIVFGAGASLVLRRSDDLLASQRDTLTQQLPAARTAWFEYNIRLHAERAAQKERRRQAKLEAARAYAEKAKDAADAELPGPGTYEVAVLGTSHYQRELERICGGRTEDGVRYNATAVLILEDENPYDTQAVRVDIRGREVGHLSRENARQYRRQLKKAGHPDITASCSALIVGGWDHGGSDRGHFGVRLDLPTD